MKKIGIILLVIFLFLSIPVSVYAVSSQPRMVDQAGLITGAQEEDITKILDEISHRQGMDVVIVTADTLDGKSPAAYADDFYDYNDYQNDGVLLLVSMEDRDWWISTTGSCIRTFTDAGIEYIGERIVPYLGDGDYEEAFKIFAETCDEFITQAKNGKPYDVNNLPKEPYNCTINLLICMGIGLVIGLISTGIMKGKLKSVRFQHGAADYVKNGSLNVTHRQDLFLYRDVKRQARPQQSSGGSRTHRSSSGRSHGGGGGKF